MYFDEISEYFYMLKILNYSFDGPHGITTIFNPVSGIYVITTLGNTIVDVGETDNLQERISSHDRKSCWTRNMGCKLFFYHEARQEQRLEIEKQIRSAYNPVCGIR